MEYESMTARDADFPDSLRQLSDTPKQLFWSGTPLKQYANRPRLAIVGSRQASPYGKQITEQLAEELARHGVVIISGLALGIDGIAHRGALAGGGDTIAVLPCSLDAIYPANHYQLARKIVTNGGTLVSEYPRGSPFMFKYNFVARNRIIAALADAVLITEAAIGSGSLHTAEFALQQGREVMVVPGNINSPTSVGTNNLLKTGATPVTSIQDILLALKIEPLIAGRTVQGDNPAEQLVLDLLAANVHEGDSLLSRSGLSPPTFNQTLTMLEISGKIRAGGANTWY